jgi:putative FmdB family regulatory protein
MIYGFRCGACGHEWDVITSDYNHEFDDCPKCGTKTHRGIGGCGFNWEKLKMDREHGVWVESKSQRTEKREI